MITEVAGVFFATVRVAGPILVVLCAVAVLVEALSRPGRARLRLAHRGLSEAQPSVVRRVLAGTLVPVLGVAALCVSLALEREVREGPNRMVDRLQSQAGDNEPAWILQAGSAHFMNDSRLPEPLAQAAGADTTGAVHRLWEQLVLIGQDGQDPDTGLLLGLPAGQASPFSPAVDTASATCGLRGQHCRLRPGQAIADRDVYPIGSRLTVRDQQLTVVAHTSEPYSLINRTVVFTDTAAFTRPDGTLEAPYAVVVGGPEAQTQAAALVAASASAGVVDVLSAQDIKDANATFWEGNGTPLILLVICLSAAFCGVALYTARRALQQRERMATGTLQALGLRVSQVCRIDLLRAVLTTGTAAVLAVPLATALVLVTNSGMLGFHAGLTAQMVLAAAGLLLFANLLGTAVMYLRVRSMSVVDAISTA